MPTGYFPSTPARRQARIAAFQLLRMISLALSLSAGIQATRSAGKGGASALWRHYLCGFVAETRGCRDLGYAVLPGRRGKR